MALFTSKNETSFVTHFSSYLITIGLRTESKAYIA